MFSRNKATQVIRSLVTVPRNDSGPSDLLLAEVEIEELPLKRENVVMKGLRTFFCNSSKKYTSIAVMIEERLLVTHVFDESGRAPRRVTRS